VAMIVRCFRDRDIDEVYEVEMLSFKDPYPKPLLVFYSRLEPEGFLVAECDSRVVGYVIGVRERGYCHIISIAVHPAYRRKGIGSALLKKLIEIMEHKGLTSFLLEVRVSNTAAINLYRRFGFRIVRRIPSYYKDGEDCFVMVR